MVVQEVMVFLEPMACRFSELPLPTGSGKQTPSAAICTLTGAACRHESCPSTRPLAPWSEGVSTHRQKFFEALLV